MIAGIATIRGDTDICGITARHMLIEGIDRLYIAVSGDEAWEVLEPLGPDVRLFPDAEQYHYQPRWTQYLASVAIDDGADYIVPYDADEFIYSCNGESLANVLTDCPFDKLYLQCWGHLDIDRRFVNSWRLPKVAYRAISGVTVSNGNHECSLPDGRYGIIALRELKYRSFEQFCSKVNERNATIDPVQDAVGAGAHHSYMRGMSQEQMETEWQKWIQQPTIADRIPSQLSLGLDLAGRV